MTLSSNSDSMSCIYMNSTGKYQVATSVYTSLTTNSNVYTSNDYGVTFILRSTITANNFGRFLEGSSVDETGQYIFLSGCGTFGLQNYYSKDFGVTFTQIPTNLNYGSSSCFVDRTKKVFYTSSNSSSMISSITLSDAILTETITNIPFIPSVVSYSPFHFHCILLYKRDLQKNRPSQLNILVSLLFSLILSKIL